MDHQQVLAEGREGKVGQVKVKYGMWNSSVVGWTTILHPFSTEFCGRVGIVTLVVPDPYFPV